MSQSKKSQVKPFVRVTILSIILAFLLIYLGLNYHWGDYLKTEPKPSNVLPIPEKTQSDTETQNGLTETSENNFDPKILADKNNHSLLDSMNMDQIKGHCSNLLNKQISDPVTLELATVNCVMSNFQETFQNSEKLDDEIIITLPKEIELTKQCTRQFIQNKQYSLIEKELLIGICISDGMNTAN